MKIQLSFIVLLFLLLAGCGEGDVEKTAVSHVPQESPADMTVSPAADVSGYSKQTDGAGSVLDTEGATGTGEYGSFHYQLQGATYDGLRKLDVDVLVIDIDDAQLTADDIAGLRSAGKTVLSYLSIGEAEDYRSYWQGSWKPGSPDFIDKENPEWKGNYKVRYWDTGWQQIILSRVKAIAEAGYDGVYLDIIDAYGYYEDEGRDTAAEEMIDFISDIRKEGKKVNPQFIIVPQNAPELYSYQKYRDIIDGFGKEDTWYDDDRKQDTEETVTVLKYLDEAVSDGKFVLAIDYPTDDAGICDFYRKCDAHGFACTVSDRELDLPAPMTCKEV